MATALIESRAVRTAQRPRELRPGWGTGRRTRPAARPARPVRGPELAGPSVAAVHGCRVSRPVTMQAVASGPAAGVASWRITERGIALVLATGLVIAAAALTVVTLTALRVTADSFVPSGQLSSLQR